MGRRTFEAPAAANRTVRRAQSAHFSSQRRGSSRTAAAANGGGEYTPVLKKRGARGRPGSAPARRAFAPPLKTEASNQPRKAIALDMLKFVDSKRPPTAHSRRSGYSGSAALKTDSFSALPASRPGPGPAEYYPDYRSRATVRRTPAASFSREDRMKHLAGETASETEGRTGPGPKYKPCVTQTKHRYPVPSIGREHRLGSSIEI